jgi:hypothetical protein
MTTDTQASAIVPSQHLRKEFELLPKRQFLAMLDKELFREWHVLTHHWIGKHYLEIATVDEAYFNACVGIYERAKKNPANGEMLRERENRVIHGGAIFKTEYNGQWSKRDWIYYQETGDVEYYWKPL